MIAICQSFVPPDVQVPAKVPGTRYVHTPLLLVPSKFPRFVTTVYTMPLLEITVMCHFDLLWNLAQWPTIAGHGVADNTREETRYPTNSFISHVVLWSAMSTRNDENINSVPTTLEYQPIDPVCLEDELKELQCVQKALNDDWEAEALKYEETLANGQPRRNYFNAAGVVEDPRLFPYHDVFYMLIDAYDGLYGPDEPQPMPPSSVRPSYVPLEQRRVVEDLNNHLADLGNDRPDGFCYLPCSPLSVSASVMEVHSSVNTSNTPTGGHTWTVWQILSDMFHEGKTREEIQIPQMQPLRMNLLPHERTTLYLRLLRHAMSELQRDYNLASSIIQRMCENQDLDDPDVLRRFLIVFDGEFIACENPCPQWLGEDHSCMEWATVVDVLHAAVSRGISLITLQHATVLAAFVRASYLNEFGHLLDKKDTTNSEGFATKRKTLLKRAVVALSYVDRTDSNRVPIQLVVTLVRGLGSRAWLERRRLTAALRRDVVVEGQLRAYLDSYWNCIRSLVAMGEATVELLPSEADCFEAIASEIVKNLAYAFLPEANVPDYRVQEESIEYLKPDAHPSLITPGRYSDCVANATDRWKRIAQLRRRVQVGGRDALACALDVVRPDDVREVIRSLFIRDMVNIRQAGLGYGDFLLWCGYEVHPLDPVLFWYVENSLTKAHGL